jgi:hypothetical protein
MNAQLSCVCIRFCVGQLTCGRVRQCVCWCLQLLFFMHEGPSAALVLYTVNSAVCLLFSFREQKQTVLCFVHELIFIQCGRKVTPLKASILTSLVLVTNMAALSTFVQQCRLVFQICLFRILAELLANHTNFHVFLIFFKRIPA